MLLPPIPLDPKKYIGPKRRDIPVPDCLKAGSLEDCRNLGFERGGLSPRLGRRELLQYAAPTAFTTAFNKIWVVEDGQLCKHNVSVGEVSEGEKQFAVVGSKLVVFPDKISYDSETHAFEALETSATINGVIFTLIGEEGETPHTTLSTTADMDFRNHFKVGDTVFISGCLTHTENNKVIEIWGVGEKTLYFQTEDFTPGAEAGTVTIQRRVPDLDFICEHGNRLWGCKGNRIYASATDAPKQFYSNGDNYQIIVRSDGDFTAVASYRGTLLFFKEYEVYRLEGSTPEKYELIMLDVPGVAAGCSRMVVPVNGALYYVGLGGVYRFEGSKVTRVFGKRFSAGVAGTDGTRYYLSACDDRGLYKMYVCDTESGKWLIEDDTRAFAFGRYDGRLCYLDMDSKRVVSIGEGDHDVKLSDSETVSADLLRIPWSATLAPVADINHLWVTARVREGAYFEVYLDGKLIGTSLNRSVGSGERRVLEARMLPRDDMRLELRGEGVVEIERLETQLRDW
ncbi:hypothetical protein FACS1894208_01770 [Clostridia bacterium]|nr:hypothetical protein FACS1894208_01770 [Clostridia bacterium]